MIFDRLATRVVKSYKWIISLWVVILIVSVPLTFKVNDVLVYDESKISSQNAVTESTRAADIIKKELPGTVANSSLIIVLQGNVSTPEVRDYILNMEGKVSSDRRIKALEDFTSIYSVYRQVMERTASEVPPALGGIEANLTSVSFMIQYVAQWGGMNGSLLLLWGVPTMFVQAREGVNGTAMMMYGVPSMFAQAWDGVNGSAYMLYGLPDAFQQAWYGVNTTAFMLYGMPSAYEQAFFSANRTAQLLYGGPAFYVEAWTGLGLVQDRAERDLESYNQSWSLLNASITDEGRRQLLEGYQLAFYRYWDQTFDASNSSAYLPDGTPVDVRAQVAANAVAPGYFGFAGRANRSQQEMADVLELFGIGNFTNATLLSRYTNSTTWHDLEPQVEALDVRSGRPGIFQGYYDAFASAWERSFINASTRDLGSLARATTVIDQIASPFLTVAAAGNQTMLDEDLGVLDNFGLDTWANETMFNIYTDGTFSRQLDSMAGGSGLSSRMVRQFREYYSTFYSAWNASFANASFEGRSAAERASAVVAQAAPDFIENLDITDPQGGALLETVLRSFDLSDYGDAGIVGEVTNSTFFPDLQAMVGSSGLPAGMLQSLWLYYALFYQGWNATYSNASLAGLSTTERASAAVEEAVPQFVATAAADNATMRAMLEGVHGAFGLSNWSNASLIDSFSNRTFYSSLQAMSGSMGLPPDQTQGLFIYYGMFFEEWERSYSNSSFEPATSLDRAIYAVASAMPRFSALDRQDAAFAATAYRYFDYPHYSDLANLTRNLNDAALARTRILMDEYLPGSSLADDESAVVRSGLDIFSGVWNRTFQPSDGLYLPPSASIYDRGQSAIGNATKSLLNGTGDSNVLSQFDIYTLSDPHNARNLTIDMFLGGLGGTIKLERQFVFEMYGRLGPHPGADAVRAFVAGEINNTTFGHYPVRLPSDTQASFVNARNDTMIVSVTFSTKRSTVMTDNIGQLRSDLSAGRGRAGVRTYVTGDAAVGNELQDQAFKDVEKIDPITVAIVILLVGLFFLSLVAPLFPFIGIGTAVLASQALLFIIGTLIAKVYYATNILLFVILMGTGMDYGIFILARYREERCGGHTKERAVRTAVTWAGESIATSGVAVMIGFGAMSISGFSLLQTMGIILAAAIGIGILAALTFVPSVIMVVGDRIFWPSNRRLMADAKAAAEGGDLSGGPAGALGAGAGTTVRAAEGAGGRRPSSAVNRARKADGNGGRVFYFSRAVDISLRHPWAIVAICLLLFFPCLYLWLTMAPSFDFFEGLPRTEATEGLDALGAGFGKGDILPSQVVVQLKDPVYLGGDMYNVPALNSIDNLTSRIENTTVSDDQGHSIRIIRSATPSTHYLGERLDRVDWQLFGESARNSTIATSLGKDGRTAVITIVFEKDPFQKESLDAVPVIRKEAADFKHRDTVLSNATILTGGTTPSMYDVRQVTEESMTTMRVLVVVGIFILLLAVMGSLLIPLTAIISITMSVAWTITATMLIFQFQRGVHVLWLVPLVLFVVLMGLGMDYNIFLITRVREEVGRGLTHEEAIRRSVERTGGIITILGMIMAGAFGSLMLSSLGLLQQFGFALFFAIMLDAFVVRIYLMPALLKIMGRWSWWAPGRLQRVRIGKDGHGGEARGAAARSSGRPQTQKAPDAVNEE